MKKFLTLALAAVMLFSALPAAFAEENPTEPTLCDASAYEINPETGYIENIPDFITVRELLNNFCDKDKLTVTSADGTALKLDDPAGSGALVSCGNNAVKVLVHGDVNRDAKINMKDISGMIRLLASYDVDIVKEAMDVNYDGNRNMKDVSAMIRYLAGWNVDITNHAIYDAKTAENEDSTVTMYFDHIMNRISETSTEPNGYYSYTVRTAKNEIEDVQILLTSEEEKTGLTLRVGDIVNQNGDVLPMEVRYGYYYSFNVMDTDGDRFVDPYITLDGPFDLPAGLSRSFLIKVKTPIDAEAGLYKTDVELLDSEGKVIKTAEVRVYVWDFVLDDETACDTAFGLGGMLGTDEYVQKYDYLLENRISAYAIPYDVTDSRADRYLNDPRVTALCIHTPGYGGTMANSEGGIVAAYKKLRTNPTWLEKGYLYPVDEPYTIEQFDEAERFYNRMCELIPEKDFQIVIPLAGNGYDIRENIDFTERLEPYINIWCPQSYAFRPYMPYSEYKEVAESYRYVPYNFYMWTTSANFKQYGQWRDRYEAFRERGDKMWWYICCAPEVPYANFFQCYQGAIDRMVLWQQYLFDIDGLLYWAVDNYEINASNQVSLKKTNGGDGLLIYKSELFGDPNPVPSIRFESVRDGIEDFQYLTQLEELTDRETAMKYVNRLTTTILDHTDEYTDIVEVRDELGYMLESLYAAN